MRMCTDYTDWPTACFKHNVNRMFITGLVKITKTCKFSQLCKYNVYKYIYYSHVISCHYNIQTFIENIT